MTCHWKKIFVGLIIFTFVFGHAISKVFAWGGAGSPLSISSFTTGLNYVVQIDTDGSGNVYAGAYQGFGGNGIAKYNSSGAFQTSFGPWGALGVAVDLDGNILVADYQSTGKIFKYTNTGTPISITGTNLGDKVFASAYTIAVDTSGNVYVADIHGNGDADDIWKYNSAGAFQYTITGSGGSFNQPQFVTTDGSDNVYILDSGNNRVQKFGPTGTFIMTVTGNGGAFNYPEAMAVDSTGNIFVADSGNNRIQIFNASGTFQQNITSADINASAPTYSYFNGMGFYGTGTLYVGDNSRILKITFDATDAAVTINPLSGNTTTDTTPTFSGTATDATSTLTNVEYAIDGGSYSACVADDGAFDELSETFTCTVGTPLTLASHSVTIRATDSKSNTNSGGTLPSYSFTVTAVPTATATPTADITTSTEIPTDIVPPPPGCTASTPISSPELYSATRNGTSVALSFSPIAGSYTGYNISYGYLENQEIFSVIHPVSSSSTAISYTINSLDPYTQYYFRVRAMNDCVPGPWSNSKFVSGNIVVTSSPSTPTPTYITTPTGTATPDQDVPVVTSVPSTTGTIDPTDTTNSNTLPSGTNIVIVDINGNPVSGVGLTFDTTNLPPSTQVNTVGAPELITSVSADTTSEIRAANPIEQISNLINNIFGEITNSNGQLSVNLADGNYQITISTGVSTFTFSSIEVKAGQTIQLRLPVDWRTLMASNPLPKMILKAEKISETGVKVSGISLLAYIAFGLTTSGFVILKTFLAIYSEMGKGLASLPLNFLKGLGKWGKRLATNGLALFAGDMFIQPRSDGLVFDSLNHRPISGAYVILYSPSGNLATDFTDNAGRYYVKPEPDTYRIRADALSYDFPSKIITISEDSVYSNIYIPGLEVSVTEPERKVARMSLPMDPKIPTGINKSIRAFESFLSMLSPLFYAFVFTVLFLASASATGAFYRVILVALIVHITLRIYSYLHNVVVNRDA